MKLGQIGEFGLIDLIKRGTFSEGKGIILGIGDDAAALRSGKDGLQLLTTDALVEKVHFNLSYFPLDAIGWKGMVANLSDIAAMGGSPRAAVVTLGISSKFKVEQILSIYSGISKAAKKFGCPIVGGDIVSSPKHLFVSISVLGQVREENLTKRCGAKVDDLIAVTGDLGSSLVGLEYLKKNKKPVLSITKKFLYPLPCLEESRLIVQHLKPTAMIDISDGLVSELHHIIAEKNLGANIYEDDIPISKPALKSAKNSGKKGLDYALYSGEEYELLFTFKATKIDRFRKLSKKIKIRIIGRVVGKSKKIRLIDAFGKSKYLPFRGYAHF